MNVALYNNHLTLTAERHQCRDEFLEFKLLDEYTHYHKEIAIAEDLNGEYCQHDQVGQDENGPEDCIGAVISDDLNDECQADYNKHFIGICCDVRVTELIDLKDLHDHSYHISVLSICPHLQKHQYGDDIHKSCVKLKAFVCWTDVIGGREKSLGHKGSSECIEDPVLFRDPFLDHEYHLAVIRHLLASEVLKNFFLTQVPS